MVKNEFLVVGLMSGTSLDGVDIALCKFYFDGEKWIYYIEKAKTVPYSAEWKKNIVDAELITGLELIRLHKKYGLYLGEVVLNFLKGSAIKPDFISSHGHTIFHQPEQHYTFQLGDGAYIAAKAGITTISDFRNLDVALGGQGAPLVPIGDRILFGQYNQCLNLGGFANISYETNGTRTAFDICPVNILLNHLSNKYYAVEYDKNGEIGRLGNINPSLLEELNELEFYSQKPPKSLGKEWVLSKVLPLFERLEISPADKIRTAYENIAFQLSKTMNSGPGEKVLLTGGGTYNTFLLDLTRGYTSKELIIPDGRIIDYKEALVFAFLGVLRFLNLPNCLSSVTGATADNSGGTIFQI